MSMVVGQGGVWTVGVGVNSLSSRLSGGGGGGGGGGGAQ